MGLPGSITVKLDDGSGTFPFDVTQYVRMTDGVTWSRGRPDQYQDLGPGQMTLTLENTDGRFTQASAAYNIQPDQRIRLAYGAVVRFTGRVQSWPVSWPVGGDEFAVVTITAIDDLARAGRIMLRSSVSHEILADNPAAYYPLTEAQGALFASDVTGNQQNPKLKPVLFGLGSLVTGTGGDSFAFGEQLGLPDGSTGLKLTGRGLLAAFANFNGPNWTSTNSIHFDIVVNTVIGASPAATIVILDLNGVNTSLSITTGGVISFGSVITTGAIFPGGTTHVLSINGDASATDLWMDGVKVATGAGISGVWSNSTCQVGDVSIVSGSWLTVGAFNFGSKLADARIVAHHNALLTDFNGETPTARITRVAGYAKMTVGTLDTSATQTMGPTAQAGRSALDIFNDVASSTQGLVFLDGNGTVSNVTGHSIQTVFAPTAIIDANFISSDTTVEVDMAEVVNSITGKATNSQNVTTALDPASIAAHGVYSADYEWNVATDAMAADMTNWQIATYANPFPRVPTLKHDVTTMQVAQAIQMMNLELGKLTRVTSMPPQTPTGVVTAGGDLNLIVEGISETIQMGPNGAEWSITINGVRAAFLVAWILEDATFGTLGSKTKLGF